MASFFFSGSSKKKDPALVVKATKDAVILFEKSPKSAEKAAEAGKCLSSMKIILFGDSENEPNPEQQLQLCNDSIAQDLIPLLCNNLPKFDFEGRKDTATIFNNFLRRQNAQQRFPMVEYLTNQHADILHNLIIGYENPDVALHAGAMLRGAIQHEGLAKIILYSPHFTKFFQFVELPNFDIASDAFTTLKELLTKHKPIAAEFLEKNYDKIFEEYMKLLTSSNYVTRRQSLKLLGELLLDRANFNIMTTFISDKENLKLMMNLLRDKSKSIQFEAFHVFKVFVANPNKTKPILDILSKNKPKLISFLQNFHNDNEEDQFNDEKAFLLKQTQALPDYVRQE